MTEASPHPAIVAAMKADIVATASLPVLDQTERLVALYTVAGDLRPTFAALLVSELAFARLALAAAKP